MGLKRLFLIIASTTLVLSCTTEDSGEGQKSFSTPSQSVTPTPMHIQNNWPVICLKTQLSLSEWPVEKAVNSWNTNGKNLISTGCGENITLNMVYSNDYWGKTTYLQHYRAVEVSSIVPVEKRLHVLCHEVGHALGRPHVTDVDSCMNPELEVITPSKRDLLAVAQYPWDAYQSQLTACGCG